MTQHFVQVSDPSLVPAKGTAVYRDGEVGPGGWIVGDIVRDEPGVCVYEVVRAEQA